QVLKPISPLAWMPLFLYTIRDSAQAAVLVIVMSSLWPTLANTAFGVASIKRDYLNVAAILQLSWPRRLVTVILPAAAPAIVAGLRISVGSAWVAIVAAEMLIGGTGIGEFVTMIGHSGCGKSTLLNIIAGLERPTRGGVVLEGREVTRPGMDRMVVFQNFSLMPWMTAFDNIRLAVRAAHPGWARAEVAAH